LSEQHIYDIISELLEDYTGTYRTISNITTEEDEEVDIFSTIQNPNDISDFDDISLRREVIEIIDSLGYEEKEILLLSTGFIELLSRIQSELERLTRGIPSLPERKKYRILIKNESRFLNFPPIKLGMTTNKLIKFLEKNLLQDFYNTDLSKDTLSGSRKKILKKVFESYPADDENKLELLVNDIFLEEFYKDFDVEITKEGEDNEE
jgi:2-hydroxy-3-keto-5-methylthiopentenyl-1-phosphate phosphatase